MEKKPKIFFTSDTHFGHNKDFLFGPRGFSNWIEHGEAIVENWNSVVSQEDTVYHLGDIALTKENEAQAIEWINRLHGTIFWVAGNHDTDGRIEEFTKRCPNVHFIGYAHRLKIDGYSLYLSHFPTITENFGETFLKKMVINLFGHTHQKDKFYGDYANMYNVALDAHDNFPVEFNEIIHDLREHVEIAKSISDAKSKEVENAIKHVLEN